MEPTIVIIEGDSGDVLKNIDRKYQFVYMDPPYDTGRVFNISTKDATGFSDSFHGDEYLEMLDAVVSQARRVLHPTGVLCLHISAEKSFEAELVLTRHFKDINKIFWKRCHGKNTVKNKLGAVIDIIFECCNGSRKFNLIHVPLGDTVWAFKNKDDVGNYSLGAVKHDRTRKGYDYAIEHEGVKYETKHGWKINETEMRKLIDENRIHFAVKTKTLYRKIYEHEHKGKPLSNLWDDVHSITRSTKDPRMYPTQKPVKLLQRLVALYTDEGDWVLDPVAGSGTTGRACRTLNRNATLIDKNPDACEIMRRCLELGDHSEDEAFLL